MPRLPRIVLSVGGGAMVFAGVAGIVLGVTSGPFIRSLLPPVAVDAAAVGGATVALSGLVVALGAVQLLLGRAVSDRRRWTTAAAVILSGLLAAVFVAFGSVAATQAAVSATPTFLAVAGALLLVALAYGAASMILARSSV